MRNIDLPLPTQKEIGKGMVEELYFIVVVFGKFELDIYFEKCCQNANYWHLDYLDMHI